MKSTNQHWIKLYPTEQMNLNKSFFFHCIMFKNLINIQFHGKNMKTGKDSVECHTIVLYLSIEYFSTNLIIGKTY